LGEVENIYKTLWQIYSDYQAYLQILSESAKCFESYDKNILVYFLGTRCTITTIVKIMLI